MPPAKLLAALEADPLLTEEDRAWFRITLKPSIERARRGTRRQRVERPQLSLATSCR